MHRKPGWIILAFLTIALVVLASCQAATTTPSTGTTVTGTATTTPKTTPSTTPSTTTTTTSTAPSANQPTYGGDITFFLYNSGATDYFDPVISAVGGWTAAVTYDKLVSSDWSKGPEGTNEYPFSINYTPQQYRSGVLAESWEIKSLNDMIFHIRPGVDFQAKAPANGREMNANDVVYTYQRGQKDPRFTSYDTYWDWNNAANMPAFTKAEKANGRTDAEISAWVAKLKAMNYPYLAGAYMIALDKYTVEYGGLDPSTTMLDMGDWLFVGPDRGRHL